MSQTKIAWTDRSWNPVTGCTKLSAGCRNCYAEGIAKRFWKERKFTDIQFHRDRLRAPLHWRKPSKVFVNTMSDLFHPDIHFDFVDDLFEIISQTPQHTYQILTKRPELAKMYFDQMNENAFILPNVWLGVSVENQRAADIRIPVLLQTPAAIKFVSCEPLLGPVDLQLEGRNYGIAEKHEYLDWVIAGCESGSKRRVADREWFRSLRDQCLRSNTPYFLKQMEVDGKIKKLPMLDGFSWQQYPSAA